MSFEETDTEDSTSLLSEASSLDDDFDTMNLQTNSSDEESTDSEVNSHVWNDIESDSDEEFLESHGFVEEFTFVSKDDTIDPIDCYRYFITDEVIDLKVCETNRHAEQYLQTHEISRRSKSRQWKPTTGEEMLIFLGIIIQMGLAQMQKLKYYSSNSQLYESEIIQNAMSREKFELLKGEKAKFLIAQIALIVC